jgi:antitoxin component YwqK of YwqJK toxin-antitoxin module
MKFVKRGTVLLLLMLSMHLPAQYAKDLYKLHYSNSTGEQGVTTYIYNNRPSPYKAIWELMDGSRWSVNLHDFDPQGKLLRRSRKFSDSLTSLQTFRYDENGKLLGETFSRSDGIEGRVDYLIEDGICHTAICKGLNGWFFGEIHYHYGHDGIRDSATVVMKGNRVGNILYESDEKERLLIEIWKFNTGFSQTFRYEYLKSDCVAYQSSNVFIRPSCDRVVRKEEYDYNAQGGGPSYYEYTADYRLIKKTFVRSDGLKTITDFTYFDNGLLKESTRQYNDGKHGTFSYLYNQYDQLIRRDFLRSDGVRGEEEYVYDELGKLVFGSYDHFDGWLTGRLVFKHDRYDRICSAHFQGENGMDADLSFSYDEAAKLVRIHWDFSDGSTQTYLFEYEKALVSRGHAMLLLGFGVNSTRCARRESEWFVHNAFPVLRSIHRPLRNTT